MASYGTSGSLLPGKPSKSRVSIKCSKAVSPRSSGSCKMPPVPRRFSVELGSRSAGNGR